MAKYLTTNIDKVETTHESDNCLIKFSNDLIIENGDTEDFNPITDIKGAIFYIEVYTDNITLEEL
jgi:hypothetical protein